MNVLAAREGAQWSARSGAGTADLKPARLAIETGNDDPGPAARRRPPGQTGASVAEKGAEKGAEDGPEKGAEKGDFPLFR